MILWKNKIEKNIFEFFIVMSVIWFITTFPIFIMTCLFGWGNF